MYAQIVTFRLNPDYTREQFLQITEQMVSWLKQQKGFIAYELYEGNDSWADRIVWDTESNSRNGVERFRQTDIVEQLLPFVKDDYSSFFGQPIVTYPSYNSARSTVDQQ